MNEMNKTALNTVALVTHNVTGDTECCCLHLIILNIPHHVNRLLDNDNAF